MKDRNDMEPDRYLAAMRHSRSWDAGNYANAYVSTDLETAWEIAEGEEEEDRPEDAPPGLSRKGFVLGFFSSYEDHEIPEEHLDEALAARGGPNAYGEE